MDGGGLSGVCWAVRSAGNVEVFNSTTWAKLGETGFSNLLVSFGLETWGLGAGSWELGAGRLAYYSENSIVSYFI